MPNQTIDDAPTYLTAGNVRTLLEVSLAATLTEKLRWNTAATTAPTTGDDSGDGYSVGSLWFDRTADVIYVCIDATLTAAIWIRLPDYLAVVLKATYDANTILKADSDNTPIALTVAEQRIVGRITAGVITALTAAEVRTLINVADGATANPNAVEATSTFGTDNRLLRSDSTSRLAQASGITVDDSANMSGVVGITATGDVSTTGDVVGKWQGLVTASTSITIADSHNGQIIYCTAGTTVTATIGDAVSTDVHFTIVQAGNGQVQLAVSGSVTLLKRSGFNAYTVGSGGALVVHVKQAASALGTWVSGDMEPV